MIVDTFLIYALRNQRILVSIIYVDLQLALKLLLMSISVLGI